MGQLIGHAPLGAEPYQPLNQWPIAMAASNTSGMASQIRVTGYLLSCDVLGSAGRVHLLGELEQLLCLWVVLQTDLE